MVDTLLAYISYYPVQRWCIGLPTFVPGVGGACVPLSPHGIGTMMGFLLGAITMARRARPRGIPTEEVYNAVTWGALGAIVGARGFYVIGHWDSFGSLRDILAVWEGGLTMFGGFVGGLLLGVGYLHRRGFHVPTVLDAAAPGFVVGVTVGRIGDLIIADHLGRPTAFFLGYRIPEAADLAPGYGPPTYVPGAVVHLTAGYDLIGVLVLAVVIALVAKRGLPTGTLFAVFALWYGLQRFMIDFTRNVEVIETEYFGLSGSQWAGLMFAAGGAYGLWKLWSGPRPMGEPAVPVGVAPEAAGVEVGTEAPTAQMPPVAPTPVGPTPHAHPEAPPQPHPEVQPEPPDLEPVPPPPPVPQPTPMHPPVEPTPAPEPPVPGRPEPMEPPPPPEPAEPPPPPEPAEPTRVEQAPEPPTPEPDEPSRPHEPLPSMPVEFVRADPGPPQDLTPEREPAPEPQPPEPAPQPSEPAPQPGPPSPQPQPVPEPEPEHRKVDPTDAAEAATGSAPAPQEPRLFGDEWRREEQPAVTGPVTETDEPEEPDRES